MEVIDNFLNVTDFNNIKDKVINWHFSWFYQQNVSAEDEENEPRSLSLNDCNGYTVIGDKKIESKANRALFFDPSVEHNSTNCTDEKARFNINFNYF
jgi:hypothetical protein